MRVATGPDSGNRGTTVRDALDDIFAQLERADLFYGHGTDNAWDEAVLLVLAACGLPVDAGDEVLDTPVGAAAHARVDRWLKARIRRRTPLPYLVGRAWFAGLEFRCDERALVPRSPLGELIADGFAPWWTGPPPAHVLDLCCGGGAIGIAAAVYSPDSRVVLADIAEDALALARENVELHGVGSRVAMVRSDLFAALHGRRFDLILSNPPYVDAPDLAAMPPEFLCEPTLGLEAGHDGLAFARRILRDASAHLSEGGLLFLELGNSWEALDRKLSKLALTWLEFREGGHGVLVLRADELPVVAAALERSA